MRSQETAEKLVLQAEKALSHWRRTAEPQRRAGLNATFNMLNAIAREFPSLLGRIDAILAKCRTNVSLWLAPCATLASSFPL